MVGLAQFYSDNLSNEVKKGKAERKAQGLYNGLLPFGAVKGEDGIPIADEDTHQGLSLAFDMAAEGDSDREIARRLSAFLPLTLSLYVVSIGILAITAELPSLFPTMY